MAWGEFSGQKLGNSNKVSRSQTKKSAVICGSGLDIDKIRA